MVTAGTQIPREPSNRRVLDQAQRWGCTLKARGDLIEVTTPAGDRVCLRPPTGKSGRGNSHEQMKALYDALDTNPENFWSANASCNPTDPEPGGTSPLEFLPPSMLRPAGALVAAVGVVRQLIDTDELVPDSDLIAACEAAAEAGRGTAFEAWAEGFTRMAEQVRSDVASAREELAEVIEATDLTDEGGPQAALPPALAPPVTVAPEPDDPTTHTRGAATMVFQFLVAEGEPRSKAQIAEALGIPERKAQNAGNYLVSIGQAERVLGGVYRSVIHRAPDTSVGIDIDVTDNRDGNRNGSTPTAPVVPIRPVAAATPPEYQPPPPGTLDSIDEEVDAVLDLLFPDGMTLRAIDLRKVINWTDATKALLREVRS